MSDAYPYRRRPSPPNRAAEASPTRSHAAIPVAVFVVVLGLYLGRYTVVLPLLLGILLLTVGGSFLSTRLNPLSPHFYLTRKPSWSAVGVVFLGALTLVLGAYAMWLHHWGPVVPSL
ncbi:MAG TPA: hypothetical protein VMG81_04350 [Thermoplasmata archaeon]|nr:hypothetical protein [Thermoplasmata archaeon]